LYYGSQGKPIRADVALWPISEVAARLVEVRLVGWSGLDLLTLSSSDFDLACVKTR
jgi:hypothetical protein